MTLAVEWDVKLKSQAYFIQILAYARLLSYNIKNNKKGGKAARSQILQGKCNVAHTFHVVSTGKDFELMANTHHPCM